MQNNNEVNSEKIIYGILSIIIALIAVSSQSLGLKDFQIQIGWFARTVIFVVGVPFVYYGCIIGKKIREIVKPDIVYGNSFIETISKNIFWAIGPQIICGFIGIAIPIFCVSKIYTWIY